MRRFLALLVLFAPGLPALSEEKPAAPRAGTAPAKEAPAEETPARATPADAPTGGAEAVIIGEGPMRFSVDTKQAPDLAPWVKEELIPVLKDWYPKIVELLASKDFTAPNSFSVVFDNEYKGVAATMGTIVVCNPAWYRKELKREALGSVVHELVHVVQQYLPDISLALNCLWRVVVILRPQPATPSDVPRHRQHVVQAPCLTVARTSRLMYAV